MTHEVINHRTVVSQIINLDKYKDNDGIIHPPILIFGGMGSSCSQPEYFNLIKKLKEGLNQETVKCYPNKVFGKMADQTRNVCD